MSTSYDVDIYDTAEWTPRPTLSSADYAGPETWQEERERIWWNDWVCIGRAEEVPSGRRLHRPRRGRGVGLRDPQRGG